VTIAIGALSPEGAVLVGDSMNWLGTPTGTHGFLRPKPPRVAAGIAWVHSGSNLYGVDHARELEAALAGDSETTFYARGWALKSIVTPLSEAEVVIEAMHYNKLDLSAEDQIQLGAQAVICASVPSGELCMITDDDERWATERGLFVVGAASQWAHDQGFDEHPGPTTLLEATALVRVIADGYIKHQYGGRTLADFAAEGVVPPVAYPLHFLSILPTGATLEWSVNE